jgi:hypothetical protein
VQTTYLDYKESVSGCRYPAVAVHELTVTVTKGSGRMANIQFELDDDEQHTVVPSPDHPLAVKGYIVKVHGTNEIHLFVVEVGPNDPIFPFPSQYDKLQLLFDGEVPAGAAEFSKVYIKRTVEG